MMVRTQNRAHLFLSLALLFVTFTLSEPLLIWVQVLLVSAIGMRLALFFDVQRHLPSIRTINLLALLCAVVLAYSGWQLGLLLGMSNLLAMGCALKLMRMRKHQDYFRLIAATFFLICCGFIYQQSLFFAVLYSGAIILLLLSLTYHVNPSASLKKQAQLIGTQCLQAAPITIVLFLIIPQIEPLWRMPTGKGAETGLSDTVTPGDIASLSQSSDLAFRATFNGAVPTPQERYWRALVLEDFDGSTWRVAPQRQENKRLNYQLDLSFRPDVSGDYFDYEIIAEATQQPWLYALDIAQTRNSDIWLGQDYQIRRIGLNQSQFKYQVRSFYQSPLQSPNPNLELPLNLQTPNNSNPRTQEWVNQLKQQFPDKTEFIQAVNQHFASGKYRYTLQPIAMPQHAVDTLLFDAKAGFCAHYASAMALIMRHAGIPARMVTGYLGGEMRSNTHMNIYQYDAHAWVEIWLDEKGWVQLDPTALVSPQRISLGLEAAVAYEDTFLLESPFTLAKFKDIPWLNQLREAMDDVDYAWSKWFLGFDQKKQVDLFASILGNLSPHRIAALTIGAMFCIGILLAAFQFRIWFPKVTDPLLHQYQTLLNTLEKQGFTKPKSMPADAFSLYLLQQTTLPLATEFRALTQQFVKLRYAGPKKSSKITNSLHDEDHVANKGNVEETSAEVSKKNKTTVESASIKEASFEKEMSAFKQHVKQFNRRYK